MTADVYLGLGSNLGDRAENLRVATARLASLPDTALVARSGIYETPPWGVSDQPAFLNSVLRVETALDPHGLLDRTQALESDLGRVRGRRWGPRLIDIDILVHGTSVVADERLVIPHLHLFDRAFVLLPLAEIAPDLTVAGRSVRDALAGLDQTGITRLPD